MKGILHYDEAMNYDEPIFDTISEPKQYVPSTHLSKQDEDNKVLGMHEKQIIGVTDSGIRWFSYEAWQRRCIKTSVGERVGRRHLGGRFIEIGFIYK